MAFDAILWAKLKSCASLKDGKIPSEQLPSYIDDVIEVASFSDLPQTGEKSKIYYVKDSQESYRWGSTEYILITTKNTDSLATKEDIKNFVTESDVDSKIAAIDFPEIDLSNYYDKDQTAAEIESAIGELVIPSKISDLEGYDSLVDKSFVADEIAKIEIPDTSNFVTMQDVEAKGYLSKVPDGFATEEFVLSKIAEAELNDKDVDLSSYATKDDIKELASESYVDEKFNSIDIPEIPTNISSFNNDSGFITNEALADYAKTADLFSGSYNDLTDTPVIPSIEGLATEDFVTEAIANAKIDGEQIDFSEYAKKTDIPDVSKFISEIPSEYVTEEELNAKGFITKHQDLSDYATKDDLPDISQFITSDELDRKADTILFTEDYIVNNPVGSFEVGDSVKNLTIRDILTKLLNLSIADSPDEPPVDPDAGITLANIKSLYATQDAGASVIEVSNASIVTDDSIAAKDMQGVFEDSEGNIGYQLQYNMIDEDSIAKIYIDPAYEVVEIQSWDISIPGWNTADSEEWIWEESPALETITINGESVEKKVYKYNVEYTGGTPSTEFRFILGIANN